MAFVSMDSAHCTRFGIYLKRIINPSSNFASWTSTHTMHPRQNHATICFIEATAFPRSISEKLLSQQLNNSGVSKKVVGCEVMIKHPGKTCQTSENSAKIGKAIQFSHSAGRCLPQFGYCQRKVPAKIAEFRFCR
jgi:hypothetical protein